MIFSLFLTIKTVVGDSNHPSVHVHDRRSKWERQLDLEKTMQFLFPNRTKINHLHDSHHHKSGLRSDRKLQQRYGVLKEPYDPENVKCVKCSLTDLETKTCTALENFQIQEIYYKENLERKETCKIIDRLGYRVSKEIFGNGRTFRNTTNCRDIVMQVSILP